MDESRRGDGPSPKRTGAGRQKTSALAAWGSSSAIAPLVSSTPADRKPRRKVLREEEYLSTLGAILRRDFFPTLDRLEAQYEYLTAMEKDDLVALREAANRLNTLEHRRQQRTNQRRPMSRASDLNLSLDEFQARYVTEDTADFEELLTRINAARLAKYRRVFHKNAAAVAASDPSPQPAASSSLMLAAAPDPAISQGALGAVRPDQTRLEAEVELGILERDPTDIRHHYWRMLREHGLGGSAEREPSIVSSGISQVGGAPNSHYDFVETPQRDTDADAPASANQFRIPPTPSREALGHKMASSIVAASSSSYARDRRRKLLLKSPAVQRLLRAHTPRRTESAFDTPRRPNK